MLIVNKSNGSDCNNSNCYQYICNLKKIKLNCITKFERRQNEYNSSMVVCKNAYGTEIESLLYNHTSFASIFSCVNDPTIDIQYRFYYEELRNINIHLRRIRDKTMNFPLINVIPFLFVYNDLLLLCIFNVIKNKENYLTNCL